MVEFLLNMSMEMVVTAASAVGSAVAVVVSLIASRRQQALAEKIAAEERRVAIEQVRLARDTDIIRWADRCIYVLAEMEAGLRDWDLITLATDDRRRARELLYQLSAEIDCGRVYFPNNYVEGKGEDKPRAFRGSRQVILTHLVRCHDLFAKQVSGAASEPSGAADQILGRRRLFVSEVQLAINPSRYIAFLEMQDMRSAMGEAKVVVEA